MRYKRCLSLILALGMATTCMPMGMGLSEEAIVPVIEVMEEPQPAEVKIEEPTVVYSEAEQTDVTSDGNEDADGLGVIQTEPEDEVVDVQKSSDDQSSDPVVDVLVLEAPTLVYDPEWDYDETTELLTIPAASEDDVICLEWTAVDGAVDYCVETSELAGSGELAAFIELDRCGDESVELTAKDYLEGWYALFITAKAEDGQEAQFVQVFRVILPAADETIREATVYQETATTLAITKQPVSVTVAEGEIAKVSVEASGEGLSYAWWIASAGSTKFSKSSVTGSSYSVTMNASRDGRQLYCVITDASGNSVTSNTVTMNMKPSLVITKQPESVTVAEGELAKVSVEASGEGLSYAWWIASAGSTKFSKSSVTGSSYSTVMNASRSGRQLYCVITDASGNTVTTDTVTMNMLTPLVITKQPESVRVAEGEIAKVSVEASGDDLSYLWWYAPSGSTKFYKSSVTKASYAVQMNATRAGRRLYCVVTDAYGKSVQSETVTIDLSNPLEITKQLESVTVAEGERAKVGIEASGDGLSYEWWIAAAGSTKFSKSSVTGSSYSTVMNASRSGRQVYCIITDAYGASVQSDTVTLNMITPLEITKQPVSATALAGENVEVIVEAVGDGLTYEWWWATATSTNFSKSSITTNVYAVPMNSTRDGRKVYCVVTDAYGNSVTSDTVSIHLNPGFVYEYSETYGGLVITGFTGADTAISIPEAMNGETVTCVGDGAFMGNASLQSVKIPQTVTRIGENAFKGCSSLTDVNVPNGITKIEASTFEACTSLTSITLPDCITVIGTRAFYGCTKLASMNSNG